MRRFPHSHIYHLVPLAPALFVAALAVMAMTASARARALGSASGLVSGARKGSIPIVASLRERLRQALRTRLVSDLSALAAESDAVRFVSWEAESEHGGLAVIGVDERQFKCRLTRNEGSWMIENAEEDGVSLSHHFRSLVRDVIDKELSLEVVESRLKELPYIAIADFSATPEGQLPIGWGWRDRHDDDEKLYEVKRDGNRSYLAAQDRGASVILLRSAHWNPRSHPIMTWCWRADALPPGGDERYDHTNDSVAGVYVIFSQNWLLRIPKHIKYVWSTTLPEGTVGRRNRIARPYFFVLESGDQSQGKWTMEVVDLQETYRRVYKGKPNKRTSGIGILTDANSTNSFAEAYYSDIRVWPRSALEQGLITDYCNCSSRDSGVQDASTCDPLPSIPETITSEER